MSVTKSDSETSLSALLSLRCAGSSKAFHPLRVEQGGGARMVFSSRNDGKAIDDDVCKEPSQLEGE